MNSLELNTVYIIFTSLPVYPPFPLSTVHPLSIFLIMWLTIAFSFDVIINTCLQLLNPSINLSITKPIKITLKNPNNPLSTPNTLIANIQTDESVSNTDIPIPIGVNLLIIVY